eukprot:jgi/Orpsp1_1/1174768/evm.model.c7180000051328.1
MKYNTEIDINIFIAELQNTIDELESIDVDLEASTKAGILNRCLPEELRWINVFQYKNDWIKCSNYVKEVIPEIISSNLRESINNNNQNKSIFSLEKATRNKQKRFTKGKKKGITKNGR